MISERCHRMRTFKGPVVHPTYCFWQIVHEIRYTSNFVLQFINGLTLCSFFSTKRAKSVAFRCIIARQTSCVTALMESFYWKPRMALILFFLKKLDSGCTSRYNLTPPCRIWPKVLWLYRIGRCFLIIFFVLLLDGAEVVEKVSGLLFSFLFLCCCYSNRFLCGISLTIFSALSKTHCG